MSIKIPRFRGGGVFWVWGGGSADCMFMGARIFLKQRESAEARRTSRANFSDFFSEEISQSVQTRRVV